VPKIKISQDVNFLDDQWINGLMGEIIPGMRKRGKVGKSKHEDSAGFLDQRSF